MDDAQPAAAPLVSGPFPVTVGNRGEPPRPAQALVFSTADGTIVELPRRPGAVGSAKYCYRYVVDCGDHRTDWQETLPSGTGGFGFQAALEARWRVESAKEVVSRDITAVEAAEAVVQSAMRELLWPHAARYGLERMGAFADFIRSGLYGRRHPLDEGLVVTGLTVRLYLDPLAEEHLRKIKQREFDRQLSAAQHHNDKAAQDYQAELQSLREQAILTAARGEGGLKLTMIAQDPGKLREILGELANRQDAVAGRKEKILDDLLEAKLIQPAEARAIWDEINRPVPLFSPDVTGAQSPTSSAGFQLFVDTAGSPAVSKPPKPRFQAGVPQPTPHDDGSQAAPSQNGEKGSQSDGDSATGADTQSGTGNVGASASTAPGNVVGSVPVGGGRAKMPGD